MKVIRPIMINSAMVLDKGGVGGDIAYQSYNPATTYAKGQWRKIDDDPNAIPMIYESLQDNNTGHYPTETLDIWWAVVKPLPGWELFDASPSTMTWWDLGPAHGVRSIYYRLAPGEMIDALALINLDKCIKVDVVFTSNEGVILNRSIDLRETSGIIDWYTYFTRDISFKSDLYIPLPPAIGELEVTLWGDYDYGVGVGCLVIGKSVDIGGTKRGLALGITDYSEKTVDDWKNTKLAEGPYSRRMEAIVRVKNQMIDFIDRFRSAHRATPLVWIGSELYGASIVYGYFIDFTILVERGQSSDCSLTVEGMV